MVLYHAGDMAGAIMQQHKELIINERCLGSDHPDTAHRYSSYLVMDAVLLDSCAFCAIVLDCTVKTLLKLMSGGCRVMQIFFVLVFLVYLNIFCYTAMFI